MTDMLSILLTVIIITITAIMIIRKTDSKLVFFFVGICALLLVTVITGASVSGEKTTGNIYLDVADMVREKFVKTISGTGITLMIVASYVMLMNHIKASEILAGQLGKVLIRLRNPYLVLSAVFITGSALKVFITSQAALGMLFVATFLPTLVYLGIDKIRAVAVFIAMGMLDMGPSDSSAIFGAVEIMAIAPMDYFVNYELKVGAIIILFLAFFYPLWFKFLDKRTAVSASQSIRQPTPQPETATEEVTPPLFYGLLPMLPLLIIIICHFIGGVEMNILTANLISIFFVLCCELYIYKKIQRVAENTAKIFEWMGQYFSSVVTIIIAASVFAEAITQLGGLTIIASSISHLPAASLITMAIFTSLIFFTALLTGSGNAPWYSFGPLVKEISTSLHVPLALLAVPMHLSGMGRTLSPFNAGVIAISGMAKVEIKEVIKINLIPITLAYIINLSASYFIFNNSL